MIKLKGQIKNVTKLAGVIFTSSSGSTISPKLQAKTVTPSSESQVVTPDSGFVGLYKVNVEAVILQEKTVAPSAGGAVVTPDYGYSGLEKVTVQPATLQEKTVFPATEEQVITPDAGNFGLGKVTVKAAPLQEKTVTPTVESQTVKPDIGFYGLASVVVDGQRLAKSVSFVKDGTTITENSVLDDGSEVSRTITLDEYGQPVSVEGGEDSVDVEITFDEEGTATKITVDGEECSLSWEGFD